MSDTNSNEDGMVLLIVLGGSVVTWILLFVFFAPLIQIGSAIESIIVLSYLWVPAVWIIVAIAYVNRRRPKIILKSGDALDDETLNIYTPTLRQLDSVTPIYNIEEVGKYAECPYCGSNIRDTFYELGGIVRCDKCGAFHHKECFEYYGNKCGSSSCKLREA